MIKTLEKSGRTEEDAIQAALKELGLERDDVSVEILERAKSGFFGICTADRNVLCDPGSRLRTGHDDQKASACEIR